MSELNLEPGQLVGGYTLISRLGAGAMGSVWRVRDDGGQVYAMKILRDSLSEDDLESADPRDPAVRERLTARERLRREAMALRRVHHPGVCAIVDMELDDSLAFIVTELIEGKNLRDDVAANGRYVADDLERLARKLIEAVRAVHAAGIVHRDIKPTNVMVSAAGPVLVDFGIAMGEGESHVTRTGLVMGTPGFIAPEIIDGAESDEQTDWWSLASVLAFAATGAPVFGTKPMMAVLERAAAGNANLNGLPAGTMAAFRSALDPDRSKRCTPEQLLQAIELDAMNPFAWESAQSESGETEVVRPFDDAAPAPGGRHALARLAGSVYAAPTGDDPHGDADDVTDGGPTAGPDGTRRTARVRESDPDNPRTLWRSDPADGTVTPPATTPADGGTAVLPTIARRDGEAVTRVIFSTPLRTADAGTTVLPASGTAVPEATAVLPTMTAAPSRPTTALPTVPAPGPATMPSEATATMPTTTAMPGPTTALPTDASHAATTAMPAPVRPVSPAPATTWMPAYPPAQPPVASSPMTAPMAPDTGRPVQGPLAQSPIPPMPPIDPTVLRRRAYYDKGMLPCLLMTVPIALLAASVPLIAFILAFVLLWLLLAAGLNTEAQLRRESKHGGERRAGDALWRTASLPWHLLKGLVMALPRMLAALFVFLCGTALSIPVAQLPTARYVLPLGAGGFSLTLPSDVPASAAGAALAMFAACGWLFASLAIAPDTVRVGAGALSGLAGTVRLHTPRNGTGMRPASPQPQAMQPGTANAPGLATGPDDGMRTRLTPHAAVAIAVWAAVTLAAVMLLATGTFIDWSPLIAAY